MQLHVVKDIKKRDNFSFYSYSVTDKVIERVEDSWIFSLNDGLNHFIIFEHWIDMLRFDWSLAKMFGILSFLSTWLFILRWQRRWWRFWWEINFFVSVCSGYFLEKLYRSNTFFCFLFYVVFDDFNAIGVDLWKGFIVFAELISWKNLLHWKLFRIFILTFYCRNNRFLFLTLQRWKWHLRMKIYKLSLLTFNNFLDIFRLFTL